MKLNRQIGQMINQPSEFNRSFAKLFSASIAVAVITMLAMPIVSRLYGPAVLGELQLLLSIIAVFASISSFKYETAIVLPKSQTQSQSLLLISCACLLGSTLLFSMTILLIGGTIFGALNAENLKSIMYLIPVGIFMSGLIQILQFYLLSIKDFGNISKNRIVQPLANQSSSIGLGLVSPSMGGLIVSHFASQLLVSILMFRLVKIDNFKRSLRMMPKVARRYIKFPTVSTLNVLLNTFAMHLPVFVLAVNYSAEVIGIYMLVVRILDIPLSMAMSSVGQVYNKFAADDYHKGPERLRKLYLKTLKNLLAIGMVFLIISFLLAMYIVEPFLGIKWMGASSMMAILVISKFSQLLNVPLSSTLMILQRQELATALIIVSVVARYLSLVIFTESITHTLISYSLVTTVYYFTYNIIMFKAIK